ncbi:MAG: LysR family transcriptional regulator [Acidocella sp.]|nr:LysR family transcriptional regulator [Acidocella sp.]
MGKSHYRSVLYFDAVRRYGSVREAARHLGLAASAVNRQILNLEDELEMPLFDRLPGGMRLTAAGEAMARHAILVLQDERRVFAEFDALRGVRHGEISVVAAESLNEHFLPEILGQMAQRYPGVKSRVETAGSNDILDVLRRGDADLGLGFSLPRQAEWQQLAVGAFRLGAVMRPDHALASEAVDGMISFGQCVRHKMILPTPSLSIHSLLEGPLRRIEGRVNVVAQVSSLSLMRTLTLTMNAISFQARIGLERELASGALVFLPLARPGPVITELGFYFRAGRIVPVALAAFLALAREHLAACEALDITSPRENISPDRPVG